MPTSSPSRRSSGSPRGSARRRSPSSSRTRRPRRCCAPTASTWPRATTSAPRSASRKACWKPPDPRVSSQKSSDCDENCERSAFGAELGALDLAAGGLRQLVDEVDDAGSLVGRGLRAAVVDQLAGELLARLALPEDDDRAGG